MRDHALASRTPPAGRALPPLAPVLIEVPALGRDRRPRLRRRRRLRREVRWAGSALLIALPASWSLLGVLGASGPARTSAAEPPRAAVVAPAEAAPATGPPAVSLSLEPIAATGPAEGKAPLVRPAGYLLPPDDPAEEAADAGG